MWGGSRPDHLNPIRVFSRHQNEEGSTAAGWRGRLAEEEEASTIVGKGEEMDADGGGKRTWWLAGTWFCSRQEDASRSYSHEESRSWLITDERR